MISIETYLNRFPELNISKVGERLGMNLSYLRSVKIGKRKPSKRTNERFYQGMRELIREMDEELNKEKRECERCGSNNVERHVFKLQRKEILLCGECNHLTVIYK